MGDTAPDSANQAPDALWVPHDVSGTSIALFMKHAGKKAGKTFETYHDIHAWSVEDPEDFWESVWEFCALKGERGNVVIERMGHVPYARFFPDSRINYTENMLAHASAEPDRPAIIGRTQDGPDRIITWKSLAEQISIWQQALEAAGIEEGDRVGVYLPNIPETVIVFLAAANIGAVLSSAGMEMGADDLIGRFSQVQPKILITADGYVHGQKTVSRMDVIAKATSEIYSIQNVVVLPLVNGDSLDLGHLDNYQTVKEFIGQYKTEDLYFKRRAFNHPLYVLFSSGTTGKPKCFEHSAGGVLLKHMSEMKLNSDIKARDVLFYHATPSWMMWNWLVGALGCGATILMYDGSPAYPDGYAQWAFTSEHGCTHHGTAAPVILSWKQSDIEPADKFDLSALRVVMSTGAVLPEQGYRYIHDHVKKDVKISSISGGTDIVGCFLGGNPLMPTYAGQINGPMLGMNVQVWNEEGVQLPEGEAGELVCTNPFPSMPLRFLDDPEAERYADEYFSQYPSRKVWRHGDSIVKTAQGQFVIIGRSDATLNQNGVRIGASTIYKQLEPFADQIEDYAAVDFIRPDNKQSITLLFLVLKDQEAKAVPDSLQISIKHNVKVNVTPYAIPTEILAVPGILKTPNGKKAEVVMKKVIHGKTLPNPSLYGKELVGFYERFGRDLAARYGG